MSWVANHSGEFFSTLTAVLWAIAIILFRKSGEYIAPMPLNMFKNTLASVLFPISMLILGLPLFPSDRTAADWIILLISGAVGIGIADTLLFYSLNRIGAGKSAIIESGYSPCVILCSALYLHEPLRPTILIAVVLMVSALLIGSLHNGWKSRKKSGSELRKGFIVGVLSMILMAIGIVMAKPVLDRAEPWWATSVRLYGGMGVLLVHSVVRKQHREVLRCFLPSKAWKAMIPGAIIGGYLAMFFWILGMKYTQTTTASVLNQSSALFLMILATLILKEPLTRRKVAALVIGFAGAVIAIL